MELISPDSTCQEIEDLYQDMCQLQRLLRRSQCKEPMVECIQKEILDSIKEHLWHKWLSIQLEGKQEQSSTDASWPGLHAAFAAANQETYEKFTAAQKDSYEEMMAIMRDIAGKADGAVELLH